MKGRVEHAGLGAIRDQVRGTGFEHDLYLVGGAVRDRLLGLEASADFDLVTRGSSMALAELLTPISTVRPIVYERFGTAMLQIEGAQIELVTARRESYDAESRKPDVEPATLEEDASRRDFTINALLQSLDTGEIIDPTGMGLADLEHRVLRTPLDPVATFYDDPLRMLRAIRFRWRLGFEAAPDLYPAIRSESHRIQIVSSERIRDEILKMLGHPSASLALGDLMELGLFQWIVPEFLPMVGCEQGNYHHLDVWSHTLLVVKNAGVGDPLVSLGALFHDIGKPPTQMIDDQGRIRFFGHEAVGAKMTEAVLRRLKFPQREVDTVVKLVKNHMRLGSSPVFTDIAARRLIRDLGPDTERLLELVEADANGLKPGVRVLNLDGIRQRIDEVQRQTPVEGLQSPLSGKEIMELAKIPAGPEVGRIKHLLVEKVLDGELEPGDKVAATAAVVRGLGEKN